MVEMSFQSLIQVLRKAYPYNPIIITNTFVDSDSIMIQIDKGEGEGSAAFNLKSQTFFGASENWSKLVCDVFHSSINNYENSDLSEEEAALQSIREEAGVEFIDEETIMRDNDLGQFDSFEEWQAHKDKQIKEAWDKLEEEKLENDKKEDEIQNLFSEEQYKIDKAIDDGWPIHMMDDAEKNLRNLK